MEKSQKTNILNDLYLPRLGTSLSNSIRHILANCLNYGQRALTPGCLLCGDNSDGAMVCAACDADLPRIGRECCAVCALPLPGGGTCGACLSDPPAFDHVRAAFAYAFPVDGLVQALKYRGQLAIAPLFGMALAQALDETPDVLIAMPLSPGRLRERGFNQAHEIARHVAKACRLPIEAQACRRISETPPQAALPYKERAKNVRNAFVCDIDLTGRHAAVVDDVMTTGATLNELAKKLKQAGAARVTGLVAARTLPFGERPVHSAYV